MKRKALNLENIYADEEGTFKMEKGLSIIFHECRNGLYVNPDHLQEIGKIIKELLKKQFISGYMIKINQGNLIPFEDEVWVKHLNDTTLLNKGIKAIAYVSPENLFRRLEIEKMNEKTNHPKILIFKEEIEAWHWIHSFQEKNKKMDDQNNYDKLNN